MTNITTPDPSGRKVFYFALIIMLALGIISGLILYIMPGKPALTQREQQLIIQRDSAQHAFDESQKAVKLYFNLYLRQEAELAAQENITDSILKKYENTKNSATSYRLRNASIHELDSFWAERHDY